MQAILGIDIGTTSICGVAVTAEGELAASVERPNDSAVNGLPPGRAEQDPTRIRERVFEVICELASRPIEVVAIGLTGQMHGMVCVGPNGAPCGNLVTWQDLRCLEPDSSGRTTIEEMRERVRDEEWSACGCLPASGFMGGTLYWLMRRGVMPARTQRVSFIHDWMGSVLTAGEPVTDPGDAASSGLFDLGRMRWHEEILRVLGLAASPLPPVRESGEVIGTLCAAAAEATGLPAGVPICNGTGDNQASVLGSLADPEHSVLLNIGTGGQISWCVPTFVRAAGMETRYLPRGRFMLVGTSLCGGRAYAWLNDVVRGWLSEFGCNVERSAVYERLNALAASAAEDCGGLAADTRLAGTRIQPAARGALHGISLENLSLANVGRAILSGVVDELHLFLLGAGTTAPCRPTAVVVSGNAVRKNAPLRGIIASRLGLPVLVPRHLEEAAFGAAMLAGTGVRIWGDIADAGRCIRYLPSDTAQ